MATEETGREELTDAYRAGRRVGLGISALALGLVSFLSLLGAEKAILAMVLGTLAIRGSGHGALARRLGIIAVCLGTVFLLTLAVVLIVFRGEVLEFVRTFQRRS